MISQCQEDGAWTPVEVQCSMTSVSFSIWSVITITVLVLVILFLLSCLLWVYGYDKLKEILETKPSLTSQGVCTRNINLEISQLRNSLNISSISSTVPSFCRT